MKIEDLLEEGETLFFYTYTGSYCKYCCIIPEGSTDLAAALEDTLHRILSCSTARDVQAILGAHIPSEEEWEELEKFGEYIVIDLGYIIPGLLVEV